VIVREVIIGNCRLIQGDCLEVMPMLEAMDCIITDPPYGIGFPYNSYDDTPEGLQRIIDGLTPFLLSAGRAVVTPGNTNVQRYPQARWLGAWTWDTTTARGMFGWSQWQPILLYGEDVWPGTNSQGGGLKSDRIHFSGGQAKISDAEGMGHTCPKPIEFMRRLVNRFSLPSETVIDPFLGSGTTGVACVNLGRAFIGIELDPGYFDIAVRRITDAHRQADFFVNKPAPVKMEQGAFDV